MAQEIPTGVNQNVTAGQLIRNQGSAPDRLIILHKGTISIRNSPEGGDISKSKYISSIPGPAIISSNSLFLNQPTKFFSIAETNCVVSSYPTNQENFKKILVSKPNIAVLMLRTILKEYREFQKKTAQAGSLLVQCVHTVQSLSLAFSKILPDQFNDSQSQGGFQDPILETAKQYIRRAKEMNMEIPVEPDLPFLMKDHSDVLGKENVEVPEASGEDADFLLRFISLDANIIGAIARKDPALLIIAGKNLGKYALLALSALDSLYKKTEQYAGLLFTGDYCWVSKAALQTDVATQNNDTGKGLINVSNYLTSQLKNIENNLIKIWSINRFTTESAAYRKVAQYAHIAQKESVAATQAETGFAATSLSGNDQILNECKNSAKQIMQWAQIDAAKQKETLELLQKIKTFANPLDSEGEIRKIRRHLTNLYWFIYEKAILKFLKTNSELPRMVELMFLTGYFDEELLEDDQVLYLFTEVKRGKSKYPILDTIDWLSLIYHKKIPNSITELGTTFFDHARQEYKDNKWKRESDLPPEVDSPEARVKFEIHNMLSSTTKLTSGSIMTHFPIINKHVITTPLERAYFSKEKLEEQIDTLLAVDFGAFHREVLFSDEKIGINREFIQIQVIPHFILVPSYGNMGQFWQEREGNNRTSRGRLALPFFCSEDSYDMLIHLTGAYRWELVKTIMGPDWNNITTPSITADYTDYVQFYKKNRDLSPEIKEKLSAEFKRFRDDRSRFVNDYYQWVKYESEGTQRLNKVIRKIMAKHIPFSKTIRENLLKLPNFTEIIQKATNVKLRKAVELGPRYKKYRTNNNGILPKELEDTIKYYKLEF